MGPSAVACPGGSDRLFEYLWHYHQPVYTTAFPDSRKPGSQCHADWRPGDGGAGRRDAGVFCYSPVHAPDRGSQTAAGWCGYRDCSDRCFNEHRFDFRLVCDSFSGRAYRCCPFCGDRDLDDRDYPRATSWPGHGFVQHDSGAELCTGPADTVHDRCRRGNPVCCRYHSDGASRVATAFCRDLQTQLG